MDLVELLVNVLLALLAFFGIKWLAAEVSVPHPMGVIVAAIVAVIVFLANLAERIV